MTRTELYTFVTTLLTGIQIDETTFETLLDIAQMNVEDTRPWVVLRDVDNTQTIGGLSGSSFYNLNANFKEWYDENHSVMIVDGSNNPTYLKEIPMAMKFQYQNTPNRFYVDYSQNKLYLCGSPVSGTIYQFFIKSSPLVSADNVWVFPTRYHKLLGLYVAVYWKEGIDYDIISNLQANQQATQAVSILNAMTIWDNRIQKFQQTGVDYGGIPQNGRNASGGFVPYL